MKKLCMISTRLFYLVCFDYSLKKYVSHLKTKILTVIDPFNTDAYWFRHQLHLKANEVELAIKDLDSITDNNKAHLGAFDAKARIYQALGILRQAITNYSAVIRLKPDDPYGFYQRAVLFEKESEDTYANEDFKIVRQLDPKNEHAIFNLATYSFQKQLWEDAIQAFTRLIELNSENGQAYLYRGRANAAVSRWDDALEVDIYLCKTLAILALIKHITHT